jgi:enoyl-CoA hydratase/carnithine racemase
MPFGTIEAHAGGARGSITLNRPAQLNPLGLETLHELAEAARWFDRQAELKVVVVAGAGRAFSAGADVSVFADAAAPDALARREAADAGRVMAEAIESMRAVTIARIHGHCVGGAVVLAAACDLRVAAEDARFSIPEVELGIPLAWGGIPRLVREIGAAITRELVLTCRPFGATEARALGFVNRVVAEPELDREVEKLVALLAERSSHTLAATKRAVAAASEAMVPTAGAWSDADALLTALADPESRATGQRYLEQLANRRRTAEQ